MSLLYDGAGEAGRTSPLEGGRSTLTTDTTILGSTPAASQAFEAASASFALARAADGFSVLITRALIRCLGAAEGMTRQSQTEKTMPREMVAAVSHRGTPTRA